MLLNNVNLHIKSSQALKAYFPVRLHEPRSLSPVHMPENDAILRHKDTGSNIAVLVSLT
jgi:hypothetical protein